MPHKKLITAAKELSEQIDRLAFAEPITHVYNPLTYAWEAHVEYLTRYGATRKRVIFLGMNPGPFGMVQTGIPFGEIAAVRDWLQITAPIKRPAKENPKRPVEGYACKRSEVSGRRLWGLFAKRFKTADTFFTEHFVVNYCPLAFCEISGRNVTPDKLAKAKREVLTDLCDAHMRRVVAALEPEWIIGVGAFARERGEIVAEGTTIKVGQILHPSPASPKANRTDWGETATGELKEQGVWV